MGFRLSTYPVFNPSVGGPETLLAARVLISMSYNQSNYKSVWRIKSGMVSAERRPNYKFNSSGNETDPVASLPGPACRTESIGWPEHLCNPRN